MPEHILNFTRSELKDRLTELNASPYRADQIFRGLYAGMTSRFMDITTLSKDLRRDLTDRFVINTLQKVDEIRSPYDETTKFLWQLADGRRIESVIIYEKKRTTFCISSQVGCPLDCKFCATGKMGLLRNLTAGEIVEQVLHMKRRALRPPTNIVFMGMGEPLLNYDNVLRAANIMSDSGGLSFSQKKITISTSGIVKNIYRLADEGVPYSLAISLNSVDQETRREIMPVSKKYTLDKLIAAARYYTQETKRRITFEYVLIAGINDSVEDAHKLVKLTHGIPCKVNVIPCNSDDPRYQPPSDEVIRNFDQLVNKSQRTVTIRNRKGWEIKAACGQLYAANANNSR